MCFYNYNLTAVVCVSINTTWPLLFACFHSHNLTCCLRVSIATTWLVVCVFPQLQLFPLGRGQRPQAPARALHVPWPLQSHEVRNLTGPSAYYNRFESHRFWVRIPLPAAAFSATLLPPPLPGLVGGGWTWYLTLWITGENRGRVYSGTRLFKILGQTKKH